MLHENGVRHSLLEFQSAHHRDISSTPTPSSLNATARVRAWAITGEVPPCIAQ
jgi:hypothetical protein